jgi:phosphoribosylformylglycinamidine cyclo-ligase
MLHRVPGQWAFDLVGTCVGLVPLDRVIVGQHVEPGDALVGFGSSGIHSNGLTLARRVFLERAGWALARQVPECGRTLGEELLAPTTMYVNLALSLMERLPVKALAHITGDGLLNLRRIQAACGFDIEYLPPPHPVFTLIRQLGEIDLSEMYQVFNMGIGFCVVVPAGAADAAIAIGRDHGLAAWRLGGAVASEERRVRLLPIRVESGGGHFTPARR